jgi:hypothetical protein
MEKNNLHVAWTCSIDMHLGHAACMYNVDILYSMDKQHEYATQTCCTDMQQVHVAWTCSMNMLHGHAIGAWSMDLKHGHAARTCGIDIDLQYGHAAWKYVHHRNSEWTWSMDIQHRLSSRSCNMDTAWTWIRDLQHARASWTRSMDTKHRNSELFSSGAVKGGKSANSSVFLSRSALNRNDAKTVRKDLLLRFEKRNITKKRNIRNVLLLALC